MYRALWTAFGPQGWWPGESPFEVAVGAILTQNTAWTNVEKTINRLKAENILTPEALHRMSVRKLAPLLRSSGYFNVKASRLKNFIDFLYQRHQGRLDGMFREELLPLREKLLGIHGIGPETADSILLYAGKYPIFVVDAYTRRIFFRHGFLDEDADYHEMQTLFMDHLPRDVTLYNEYHALIVRVGKEFCRRGTPRCEGCPLSPFLPSFASPT
ncbi:MAG: endonuclease III domain-containing protein [Nitrospirae bacterium]|nr:endonuclease III domain-containing protein [Nitrospirota bacterium]